MEQSLVSHRFDVRKDIVFYQKTITEYGLAGEEIILDVFSNNFRSQAWEASKTLKPYRDAYYIEGEEGEKKLVHSSDRHSGKDLLEGINKEFRRGTEFRAAINYKKEIINARIGQSVVWVSPKGEDAGYVDTQINIAEKVSEDFVSLRQFQSSQIGMLEAAGILNILTRKQITKTFPDLDEVITSVGVRDEGIEDVEVQNMILGMSGYRSKTNFEYTEEKAVKTSVLSARGYLQAIKLGIRGEELKKYHCSLLFSPYFGFNEPSYGFIPPFEIRTNCSDFDVASFSFQNFLQVPNLFRETCERTEKNWCTNCNLEIYCGRKCFKCTGSLSTKPVNLSYIA